MKYSFHLDAADSRLLLLFVVAAAVILQVLDKTFGNTLTISLENIFPQASLMVFGLMVLISIIIQFVLFKNTRKAIKVERSRSRLGQIILVITTLSQYSAAGFLVIILFEALFTSQYNVDFLEIVVGISLFTSSLSLVVLSSRFVRTCLNSPSKIVLAYSIAIAILSLSGIIAFIYVDNFLQGKPDYITPYFNPWISYSPTASPDLVFAYQFTAIMSFVCLWIATIFLTSRYTSKSKKVKYWTIVSIPLVYFASLYLIPLLQQQDLLGQLGIEDIPLYAYSYNFLLNTVKAAGGIMFGIAFFLLSRTILHAQLKQSLVTVGIGLILLFGASTSSLVIMATYPPWGVISMTFLIIGSYSLLVGLDSAAFYLATDSSLRRIIATSSQKEYDILKALGHAESQRMVIDKVNSISKLVHDEIQKDKLFAISSEPTNVQGYINEVLEEVWHLDQDLLQKAKDKLPREDHG
jgi:hypothetical protein